MSGQIFYHDQYGPYQQLAQISVKDEGNGLPITIALTTGDPQRSCDNSMSISQADRFYNNLGRAIKAAKDAGIKDAGF